MKKILFALLILTLFTLFTGNAFSSTKNYREGEVLVVFKAPEGVKVSVSGLAIGGELRASVSKAASEVDSEVLDVYETISELDGNIFVLLRSKSRTTEELINELKARPDVVSVSANYKVKNKSKPVSSVNGIRPNDASFDKLWGLEAIRAPEVWAETTGSENIYAAVIDSAFYDHEDLVNNIAEDLGYNLTLKTKGLWSNDIIGHGTHVAGIVGAVGNNKIGVAGVNWNVKIIPLAIMPPQSAAQDDDSSEIDSASCVIAGFEYLASVLRNDPDIKIAAVNMSLGWYQDQAPDSAEMKQSPLYLAFKAFDNLDRTLIVVSAGNEGIEVGRPAPFDDPRSSDEPEFKKGQYMYPASLSGINNLIVVGAAASDDSAPYFTCWGDSTDIAAPGLEIFSTYSPIASGDPALYKYESGTSMSAPHVTGACALLLSKYPDSTPAEIKNALLNGANKNINPLVRPFSYESQLKKLANEYNIPYEAVKNISRDIKFTQLQTQYGEYFEDSYSMLEFLIAFGSLQKTSDAYKILDGKGKLSRTGLLDVKAALDILAVNNSNDSDDNKNLVISSSSGGCNTGFESVIFLLAASGLAAMFIRKHKN